MPVTLFSDGRQALNFFSTCEVSPAALFLDLPLPGVSGNQLLRTIMASPNLQKMVVFVLDGSGRPHEIAECQQLGVAGFLDKPVTVEDLTNLVAPSIGAGTSAPRHFVEAGNNNCNCASGMRGE